MAQMMYRSENCLPYFSAVVKNVANINIEVKKLVYIYLLHFAESEPDLALLSINTIQKSLNDGNPQVRAMALRTMSGIKVPVISQIVSLAIKKGCGDMSPHVRKAAALAIPKCYQLDPNTLPQLLDYLTILLGDKQYFVVGPAVSAFMEVCPERLDLIHAHYRSLVRKLVDMDEWGQIATLKLMLSYSRKCFPRKRQRVTKVTKKKAFYDDEQGANEEVSREEDEETSEEVIVLGPDLDSLLKACIPLLQSRNSAVLSGVVSCFLYLGTPEYLESAIGPLVALLRGPQDTQYIALYNIVAVALALPQSFVKYATHFLVRSTDPPHIWRLKLEVMTCIFPYCGQHLKGIILNELEHFSNGSDQDLVRESVRSIGKCAQNDEKTSTRCLRLLLKQVTSPDTKLVSEALTVIRYLIQRNPEAHTKTIVKLAKNLDTTSSPEARATIIWLVGEFAAADPANSIAADVLRILVKGFADEPVVVKQQIVLLGAKVYLHYLQAQPHASAGAEQQAQPNTDESQTTAETAANISSELSPGDPERPNNSGANATSMPEQAEAPSNTHVIELLWQHLLLLTRYDTNYDLRDRSRLYRALLSNPSSTQLASLLLLAPKPSPHVPSPSESRRGLKLGSATLVIGKEEAGGSGLGGYEGVPDWVQEGSEPDPALRDREEDREDVRDTRTTVRGISSGNVNSVMAAQKKSLSAAETLAAQVRDQGKEAIVRAGAVGKGRNAEKGLDAWLDEEEEESSSEEEESGGEYESDDEVEEDDEEEEEEGSTEYETDSEEETDESEDEKKGLVSS